MRYMLLIDSPESHWASISEEERGQIDQEYMALTDSIKKSGHHLAGDPLDTTATGTTVRVRNGKTVTTDGPFAETRPARRTPTGARSRSSTGSCRTATRRPSSS